MIDLKNISEFHDHTNVKKLHLAGSAEKEHDYKTLLQVLKTAKKADNVWRITNYGGIDFIVQ